MPADDVDLAVAARIQELGGVGDFRLLRFATGRADFTTGEAARAIAEAQSSLDRRAEKHVGTMLSRVGEGRPKRYAATPQTRAAITAIRGLVGGPRIGRPPARLLCVRAQASVDPRAITEALGQAEEIYDADGLFAMIAVFDDQPQLVRDLLYRLHELGAKAEEVRIGSRRQ